MKLLIHLAAESQMLGNEMPRLLLTLDHGFIIDQLRHLDRLKPRERLSDIYHWFYIWLFLRSIHASQFDFLERVLFLCSDRAMLELNGIEHLHRATVS